MRRLHLVATVLLFHCALARGGEGPLSIQPWLSEDSAASDVELEGSWDLVDEGMKVSFVRRADSDSTYDVCAGPSANECEYKFTVTLHRLDGALLLLVGPDAQQASALLLPVYWLMRAEFDDETLKLFDIEADTFEYRAAGVSIDYRHGLVLSPTNELESFLSWQVGDRSFFKDDPVFILKKITEN